ncbi:FAD-dependent oxidoreductase [Sandaracinobacteroides saxicola]|uniref:FAD-dependent monooxygenase n=1 Tax=Sandaracinobacteroides saxicola TaxID=2759707 RepID=A0A7G5IG14_9SPHN|nr:NAD(P)/FAD-dependent oxidoreductase [Sandaracinobacteroides saxicola]QMW22306.1 FAD-dependent monooxygenase [Sandaracinobacteroides saxicola]
MFDYDVIVAGAGPVGTVAAYALAQAGIRVAVLEAGADCAEDLRASTFHPSSLEMLAELGVLDELLPQGLKAPVYQYRIRQTNEVLGFDLTELSDVTPYPFRLQAEQFKLARLLAGKLAAHPQGAMRFNSRVVHFMQDDAGVSVAVETPTAIEHYRTRYLIACDGANSIIRKWLGVGFEGFTYPEKFLCLSTTWPLQDHFEDLAPVNYVADPDEWRVLLRVPTMWRVLVPAHEAATDAELRGDAKKREVFERLIGEGDAVETCHRTIYRVHQRVATRYDHGRVLLIGDAAHLNNPLGGLGMNSGIHDAINLVEKLKPILLEGAEAAPLLARFDRQRRSVMHGFVQAQTIRNKAMMESKETQNDYYEEMRGHCYDPDKRRAYLMKQSMFTSLAEAEAVA